jgi:hypothetical protein
MTAAAARHRVVGVLGAAAVLASTPTLAQDALAVPRLPGPVQLDGALEEPAWRQAARLTHADFSRWAANRYTHDPDEFTVRLFHDGATLFIAVASYDRYVEPGAAPENSDGLYSFSAIAADGKLQHYRLRWSANPPVAQGEMLDPGQWGARLRGPFADNTRPGGGYVLEFAILLNALGWRPGGNGRINIILQDHDGRAHAPYDDPTVHFARFAYGSLDNEARGAYRAVRLAP